MTGHVTTLAGPVPVVSAKLTARDRLGGWKVRWGIRRYSYTVDPGLYALGAPSDTSPVLVTANYKLSFDALRCRLEGRAAWILALDTRGINVWCAAGKGTFGTAEVARRIEAAALNQVVSHGVVVLPQLGAPGVSAPEVRRRSGFRAVWGPVRAQDLPAFIDGGLRATPEMRRVRFPLRDRLVLVPLEMTAVAGIALAVLVVAAAVAGFGPGGFSLARVLAGVLPLAAVLAATTLAGTVLTPLLLPWLPGRMFSARGFAVGAVAAAFVLPWMPPTYSTLRLAAAALTMLAGSSYLAMNFTGSSTFTSLSGVEKEMRASLPWQVAGAVAAAALWIAGGFVR